MVGKKVSLYALLSQSSRLLSGPLVLLVISSKLTSEQMSYYYSFFSIIAMQQLLEMGLGFAIKQFIAHAYKEREGKWLESSILDVKSYFRFACLWFAFIFVFILFGIGFFGDYFFSSEYSEIDWSIPWWSLVFASAIATGLTPILFLLEGCQRQVEIYKARLFSGLSASATTCILMAAGFDLYSIAISVVISNFVMYVYLYRHIYEINMSFQRVVGFSKTIKETFFELWPMVSKMSLTWVMGYFFWNSFNLIAFKQFTPDLAGKLGFTLALARAGFGIAESIVASQSTIYAKQISEGKVEIAVLAFKKGMNQSLGLLIFGYASFCSVNMIIPDLYIFNKSLDLNQTIQVFIYFILLLPVILQSNFCRCFKKEPYFYISIFSNIAVPIVFFLISYTFNDVRFIYLTPVSVLLCIWSNVIFFKTINES